MDQGQIYNLLIQNGASPDEARMLSAIAMAESSGNPGAANVSDIEKSYGLFQINTNVHSLSPEQAMDPNVSAQYALSLVRSQGYKPWSVFTNGSYKQFLGGGGESMPTDSRNNLGPAQFLFGGGAPVADPPKAPPGYQWVLTPGGDPEDPEMWNLIALPKGATSDTDTPAQTSNAQANMISAKAQQMNALINAFSEMVATGQVPFDQAMKQFQAQLANIDTELSAGRLNLDRAKAEEDSRFSRESAEASRRLGVAEEAGRRAKTMAQDVLPFLVPGATSLNLPMLGAMPLPQVNPDQLFNQGGPGDLSQLPGISPNPSVTFPGAPPLALPQVPQPTPVPSLDDTLKMLLPYL